MLGAQRSRALRLEKLSVWELDQRIANLKAESAAEGVYWNRVEERRGLYDALAYARNLHAGAVGELQPAADALRGDPAEGGAE